MRQIRTEELEENRDLGVWKNKQDYEGRGKMGYK